MMTFHEAAVSFELRRTSMHWILNFADLSFIGKRHLDIGAGCGEMLVAALERGASESIGVDPWAFHKPGDDPRTTGPNVHREVFLEKRDRWSGNNCEIIETPIEKLTEYDSYFDIITICDAMEHVPAPDITVMTAIRKLKPGGFLCTSTGGLFYSKSGHHLFWQFPESTHPWAHLRQDFDLGSLNELDRETYLTTLNRLTYSKFRDIFENTELELKKEHIYRHDKGDLDTIREFLNWIIIPSEEDCLIHMIQHLFMKPVKQVAGNLYHGHHQNMTTSWQQWLGAERFQSRHPSVMSGDILEAELAHSGIHVVFGPYISLPKGHYEVSFEFECVSPSGARATMDLEVVANSHLFLATRTISNLSSPNRLERVLEFYQGDEEQSIEMRVKVSGFDDGLLRFFGVHCRVI